MEEYKIEMLGIRKEFSGLVANDDITLQLRKGEIHALLGENGAGKSTLMSILFGMYQADKGVIKIDGEEVNITDPSVATKYHIGMVHQHFKLVEIYTVLQNIILGVEPRGFMGFIDMNKARKRVTELIDRYGLGVDLDAKISDITVGMQQRTEILKMLYRDNDVLIFDEPTAVLTPQEIDELMEIMRGLKKEGKSILFITHKLNEIMAVADRCTVLRKGKCIGTINTSDTTIEQLSEMMVGRKIDLNIEKKDPTIGKEVLRVENLVVADKVHKKNAVNDVSFNVRQGEVVVIAGIDGNGQSELVYSLTGLSLVKSGHIYLNGQDITKVSVKRRNESGMSHIPEDRHKHGLVLDFTLSNNSVLELFEHKEFNTLGFINQKNVKAYTDQIIENFDVRSTQGASTISRSMSGGNQQKAIVGREISRDTDLLIAVQPTRGLDVGAIEYIHNRLIEQRDNGKAILLVSFELDEVMNLADRILVMHEGELVGEFEYNKVTRNELGLYMAGAKKDEVNAIKEGKNGQN
ncbi:MAG: ABC transporter ATP-binding protein [Bacilli bacterium]|nr:ABC transporter ATP-binding protein [Bacilli bacterium]